MMRFWIPAVISLVSASVANAETRHGVALSLASQSISTDDDRKFGITSPGVGYGFHYIDEALGFLGTFQVLVPVHARQDGEGVNVLSSYDTAYGIDMIVAATRTSDPTADWSIYGGIGAHFNVVRLNDALLRDFEHASTGAAFLVGTRNDLGTEWLGGALGWSARFDFTADPIDLARGGNLSWAVAGQLVVAVELSYR